MRTWKLIARHTLQTTHVCKRTHTHTHKHTLARTLTHTHALRRANRGIHLWFSPTSTLPTASCRETGANQVVDFDGVEMGVNAAIFDAMSLGFVTW